MPANLRFAVLGLGMGMHHCKAITDAKGATLAAVCDHDKGRLANAVAQYGVHGYERWVDVLNDKSIDAVCVVTESGTHTDFGVQAAKAGKHIIMEKPVDISPARIQKLRAAVSKAGVKCGCIFQSRMDPCNVRLRKAIQAGKLGKIIGVHAGLPWLRLDSYFSGPHGAWRGTWKLDGGGSLMNQGIHTVDLIQWLAGPVKSVSGFYGVFNHSVESEDQAVAILKFENGALGTLYTTTCATPDGAQRVHIFGTKGSFSRHGEKLEFYEMGPESERLWMMSAFGGIRTSDAAGRDPMAVSADGHTLIIEDLIQAVRKNRPPAITIDSAAHSVEIVLAIYKSGRTGREIRVGSA